MEPLTALSLSCNVLQLIKDAATMGQVIYKICRSGKLEGVDDFDKNLQDLDKLIDMSKDLSSQPCSQTQIEAARQRVAQTLQACSSDATILRAHLQKFTTPRDGARRFGFALKTVLTGSADKVKEANSRLDKSRDLLNKSFMPVIVYVTCSGDSAEAL
jgi:DNA repair ATPase RecN